VNNILRTELAAGTRDVKWTWIARESTTKWTTHSTVHAWITSAVVVICVMHTVLSNFIQQNNAPLYNRTQECLAPAL